MRIEVSKNFWENIKTAFLSFFLVILIISLFRYSSHQDWFKYLLRELSKEEVIILYPFILLWIVYSLVVEGKSLFDRISLSEIWASILPYIVGLIGGLLTIIDIKLALLLFLITSIISLIFSKEIKGKDNIKSLFISDNEVKSQDNDNFDFNDKAEKFAERIFDQGSSEGIVFGIDAPWGTGKSSFINLCIKYWNREHRKKMIIYKFNPLIYENQENLLEKFISGLVKEIKNHVFSPEIELLISKYAELLKGSKVRFSLPGFSFELPFKVETIESVFKKLEAALKKIDKKIVVIIDDLDRLDFSEIKEILFTIKKAFTLPNISYVLCYDTENISVLEYNNSSLNKATHLNHKNNESLALELKLSGSDSEKVSEFLEKFVNIKISLYLDSKLLLDYFTKTKRETLSKNLLADHESVSRIADGLKDIFASKDFHLYLPFIGDARKLKRLINTALLLEVEKTDFGNFDFNKHDLIHLLIIYTNYPSIFRKIYNTETQGKNGFFSVIADYKDRQTIFENSDEYTAYLKNLSTNQQFILNKVFDVKQRLKISDSSPVPHERITKAMETSYACFNGSMWSSGGRNLEDYLNLITNTSVPLKTEQYSFYVNKKNEILSNENIGDIFASEEFPPLKKEATHEQLWRVLINTTSEEFTPEKSKEIICYAMNSLPRYSLLEIENIGVGFRKTLALYLVVLLDKIGWTDDKGKHSPHNTEENVAKISDWIFGEGSHTGKGVLDTIGKEERGVMGLYDLLSFRLYSCSDRGSDIFNLSRALLKHGNPKVLVSGNVVEEMREISQKVFAIFKSQFINKKRNIFSEIDNLTLKDVCGVYLDYINSKVKPEDIEVSLSKLNTKLKSFITYQLGNKGVKLGVGCGYYDVSGNKDKKGISGEINNYLFEHCFDPQKNEDNYRHFLNYLLINFSNEVVSHEENWIPSINEFTKILDKDKLIDYWKKHSVAIKSKKFETENKAINAVNYVATYAKDIESVYTLLDQLTEGIEGEVLSPVDLPL